MCFALRGDQIRRKPPGAVEWQRRFYSDEVFIEGLTKVLEGSELTLDLSDWDPLSFETVLGAARTIEAFRCLP